METAEKLRIQTSLQLALEAEKVSQKDVALLLDINQGYISMIKTGTGWEAIKDHIWEKMKAWADSRLTLADYRKYLDGTLVLEEGGEITFHDQQGKQVVPEPEEKEDPEIMKVDFEEDPQAEDPGPASPDQSLKEEPDGPSPCYTISKEFRPKEEFYHTVQCIRFEMLRDAIMDSLNLGDAIYPDWVTEYNDLYGKLEEYEG